MKEISEFIEKDVRMFCLAIVVPCYNEGKMLEVTIPKLLQLLKEMNHKGYCHSKSYIVFIDDGSEDDTWLQIQQAATQHPKIIRGLRLSCNVGHQYALIAGLDYVAGKCDGAISIDADLQDDLEAIPNMILKYREGAEIVLGVKESRIVDSYFKRVTALIFYKLIKIMGVRLIENHADFRLMSAKALGNLNKFSESNLFLRGLPYLLHQKVAIVKYKIGARLIGESKYPLRKMLALAWNGITSFSVMPLRMISVIGGVVFVGSLLLSFYALFAVFSGKTVPGWASVTVPLYFLGGLIMLSIGIVGEYLGKLFLEVKKRPRYMLDTLIEGQ